MSDALADAEATELGLREQLAELVHARARAFGEARRLTQRGGLAGAAPELADLARRYERQAEVLAGEIELLRTSLRAAEAELERLRAPDDL